MSKRYFVKLFVFALILTILMPLTVSFAYNSQYSPSQKVYVHDNANILSQSDEMMLEDLAIKYVQNYNLNVLFLTIDDADGKSTMRYSDDYMDAFFPHGVENNIAFIVDMDNREIYINTMGDAIEKLRDSEIDRALDLAYLSASREMYRETLATMADYCLDNIVNDASVNGRSFSSCLLIGAAVATLVTIIVIIVMLGQHNSANKLVAATKYLDKSDYKVINRSETMIRTYDTVQRGYYRPKSSGSSGGGSSHRSSSGRSHGGGGRRF